MLSVEDLLEKGNRRARNYFARDSRARRTVDFPEPGTQFGVGNLDGGGDVSSSGPIRQG
jgi:hypothetical protein